MDMTALIASVQEAGLSHHLDVFKAAARPAIDVLRSEEEPRLGRSRFGGWPDLPPGSAWPSHEEGLYRFLGQIEFEDVPTAGTDLPQRGLLSLFYFEDPELESEFFWGDLGYVCAKWTEEGPLETLEAPYGGEPSPPIALSFQRTLDLPYDRHQVEAWPFDMAQGESDRYREVREGLHSSRDYLLGYPSHCSLAYDPTPKGATALLTLDSDDSLNWCWHDGDRLMVFIEPERLLAHDFSALPTDAG